MARLPNTATKEERREVHVAKMEGKKLDYARRVNQRTQITFKSQLRRLIGSSATPAHINRHTGKPHDNAREIMRRTMSPAERRSYAEGVRDFLAIGQRNAAMVDAMKAAA